MLDVKPRSGCFICMDTYGPTNTPMALSCGCILCKCCLELLETRPDGIMCPMCRESRPGDAIKLCVNFESNGLDISEMLQSSGSSWIEQEAERYKANILSNFSTGVKAEGTVDLINELTTFLDAHLQDQFHDLRLLLWMLKYKRDICWAQSEAMESADRVTEQLVEQVNKLDLLEDKHDRLERDFAHVHAEKEALSRDNRSLLDYKQEVMMDRQKQLEKIQELEFTVQTLQNLASEQGTTLNPLLTSGLFEDLRGLTLT